MDISRILSHWDALKLIFILHFDQFKLKSYVKPIKKCIFSEGEQFVLKETVHLPNM